MAALITLITSSSPRRCKHIPPSGGGGNFVSSDLSVYSAPTESGGDGSDPAVLTAEDFGPCGSATGLHASHPRVTGGSWYHVHADLAEYVDVGASNFTCGHGGSIFAEPITPAGAVRQLSAIGETANFNTSGWVGTGGVTTANAEGGRNYAWRNWSRAVNEVYIRYYTKPRTGYLFGNEKVISINRLGDNGGIWWGNHGFNLNAEFAETSGVPMFATSYEGALSVVRFQNLGVNLSVVAGNWYFFEWRFKQNTTGQANGIVEMWSENLGPNGDHPGGSPTKRMSHTNVNYGFGTPEYGSAGIGNWLPENWGNPSSGGERLWADMVAKDSGPIGFKVPV